MSIAPSVQFDFDWADLAFASKKPLSSLKATFVTAPREISPARFTQIVKQYLPKGAIILGFAKEPYITGFDGQEHFRTLQQKAMQPIIDKVNHSKSPHKIYSLHYNQQDLPHIATKLKPVQVIFVRGSWLYAFHTNQIFYNLTNNHVPYQLVSPFTDESEAKRYAQRFTKKIVASTPKGQLAESEVYDFLKQVSAQSFDYNFQTGLVLARKVGQKYRVLASAHNKVVPYETFAMHYGASREENFSPPHDLNHYDTVHAEIELILEAQKQKLDLTANTAFINLMPCPPCARMLCDTDISEVVYTHDHSDGYAIKLLTQAGKKIRRYVPR